MDGDNIWHVDNSKRVKAALFEGCRKCMQYVNQLSDAYAIFLVSQSTNLFILFNVYGHLGQLRFFY